ncbi:hypothetical protein Pelo_19561 [Pelomyxa schiedti]|nr:hypothetical protein Pelo_19561 [Pelomyxa schiedti]
MWCLRGDSPGDSRWFIEKKCPVPIDKEETVHALLRNAHASVEDCQYFEADIHSVLGESDVILKEVRNADVAKWVLTTLPLNPSQETLNSLCGNLGNVEFAQWLVTVKKLAPTPESFVLACKSSGLSSSSSLAKWLSTRVTLTPSDITKGLINALLKSNIEVAEWLDVTFHVMDYINSKPVTSGQILLYSCWIPSASISFRDTPFN